MTEHSSWQGPCEWYVPQAGYPQGVAQQAGYPQGADQQAAYQQGAGHQVAGGYLAAGPAPRPGSASLSGQRIRRAALGVAAVLAIATSSAVGGGYVALRLGSSTAAAAAGSTTTAAARTSAATEISTLSAVAQRVLPSVVTISAGNATGSGVVITSDGAVLTNYHVVSAARSGSVELTFSDGKSAAAKVVGTDPSNDLAVLRASGVSALTPVSFADSDAVKVGQTVLAIGSPLGLDGSVTAGIVSAVDRTIEESASANGGRGTSIGGALQTDAAINPGNSGGALVDTAGDLVGINTAIATSSSSSGSIGLGFAISSNTAKKVADSILSAG